MPKPPKISDAEWHVMDAIWSAGTIAANEVVDSLSPRFGWSPNTIKTMLNRLVKKGALKFEQEGKRYLYRTAVSREACVRVESRSFIQRVFGGDVGPMLAHFVENAKLTPQQIKDLRKLLDQKGK
jgi:BlaI family penicillinase repressor